MQRAWDQAPVDEHGQRVDHRTGEPLAETRADGKRGWHMAWDPEGQQWMAERPGSGYDDGMPQHGEPGSWGYDENGDLLRYAERRPSYGPTQVEDVWQDAPKHYDETGREYVEVPDPDDNPVRIYTDARYPRGRVWDMGHVDGREYSKLRDLYMRGLISEERFFEEFRNPDYYEVQHWLRNRSHMDEAPRDLDDDLLDYDE